MADEQHREKPRTQKVTLVNTGEGPFVVTASDGTFVTIPPAPQEAKKPEPPPEPIKPQVEGHEKPVNEVEVELDEGMINALRQRQEKGSPLHVGGGGGGGVGPQHAHPEPHRAQTPEPQEPPRRR
jgi:hypothetical protein